jgi:uncharacterized membrane protein YphA (DoxX/SURF4 family)
MRLPKEFGHQTTAGVVRIALSLVFLWFGATGIFNPGALAGYVPSWAYALGDPLTLVRLNGALDATIGLVLLIGWQVRIVATIGGLHILGVAAGLGYNDVMIRDIGLALAAFGIAIGGPDPWSLDERMRKKKKK